MWRGGVGAAYLLPALSSAGASIASPCFRFHIPLIEPDMRISRFRLSEKGSRCRPREIARPSAFTAHTISALTRLDPNPYVKSAS
jgi:hypothetical protein